jgi:hypothetical protein
MARKTRNAKTNTKTKAKSMTVSALRKSFEHIDAFVHSKVGKLSEAEMVVAFQKEWKKCFGKAVDADKAKEYLAVVKGGKGHKGKGQHGGAMGAPLRYEMQPGGEVSVPPYVSGGFGFANLDSGCAGGAKDNLLPSVVPAGMGSNLVGGRRNRKTRRKQAGGATIMPPLSTALAQFMSRPFGTNGTGTYLGPTTSAQDATMLAKGYAGFPSPLPEINPLQFTAKPIINNAALY